MEHLNAELEGPIVVAKQNTRRDCLGNPKNFFRRVVEEIWVTEIDISGNHVDRDGSSSVLKRKFQCSSHDLHVVGLLIAVIQYLRHHNRVERSFDAIEENVPQGECGLRIGPPALVNVFRDEVVTV